MKMPDRCLPVLSAGIRSGVAPMWPQVTRLLVVRRLLVLGPALRLRRLGSYDSLLAKPVRAGLPPATIENGAGRGRCGVVRGCPLRPAGTAVNGTVVARPGEDDVRRARKSRHQLDRRVRPDPGDTRLVGKGRRRPAAAGRWDSKPPLRWPATELRSGKVLRPATRAAGASRKTSVRPPCPCSRSQRRRCRATASDFLAAGFDSYLSKQVNVVKLIHPVRQHCLDVGREGPLPARPALALAHPGALAGLPSRGDGRP